MSDETSTIWNLDPELRRRLFAEAEAEDSTVDAFLAKLLRDHVSRKGQAQDYDVWFDAEVDQALKEANDPLVEKIPDDVVRTELARRMASLRERF